MTEGIDGNFPLPMHNVLLSLQEVQVTTDELFEASRQEAARVTDRVIDRTFKVKPYSGVLVAAEHRLVSDPDGFVNEDGSEGSWARTTKSKKVIRGRAFKAATWAVHMWEGAQFSVSFWDHSRRRDTQGKLPPSVWELNVRALRPPMVELEVLDGDGNVIDGGFLGRILRG